MSIAASGLAADQTWLSAIASNVANMRDETSLSASQSASGGYQPVTVSQSANPSGGVSASTTAVRPAYTAAYDPSQPSANVQGLVAVPNVDLVTQMTDMSVAMASYRANIAVYKAASSMAQQTLNIVA